MKLYVDDEPMLLSVADLEDYERTLDFRDGVLRREIIWRTPGGKRVQVSSTRMVSFTQRHLAIMTFEVTMLDDDAPVVISSQTLNRQDGRDEYHVRSAAMGGGVDPRKAEAFDRGCSSRRALVRPNTDHPGLALRQLQDDHRRRHRPRHHHRQRLPDLHQRRGRHRQDGLPGAGQGRPADPGHQDVAYHTSRGVPIRELVDRCRRTLDRVLEHGIDAEFAAQRQWLDAYWERSDVVVHGQPALQQAVRWNLFQVAQATARAEQSGVPAKGVTGSGYSGHYFWDTEIYVLPFLTYTSPQMARSALRFRYNMLDAARRRAAELAQSGALFPWRTVNGEEASAYYAAGTAQYHIDADIAYALCKYVDGQRRPGVHEPRGRGPADRDRADVGRPRASGGSTAAARTFHVHGVTGPDEYTTVVNDNLFTNVMARYNLQPGRQGDAAAAQRPAQGLPAGGRPAGRSTGRGRGVERLRRRHGHPVRRGRPGSTRRTPTSWTARCGTWPTRRRRSGRCCCTTTRW